MTIDGILRPSLSLVLFALLIIACESTDELNTLRSELTVTGIKLSLATSANDNNLITKIDADNEAYTIHFESGDPLSVKSEWITDLVFDSANWQVRFEFRDGSEQAANFLGDLNLEQDDVVLNPYLVSPLAALAQIETPVKGKFKVIVKGKEPHGIAIEKTFSYFGEAHRFPILGLYEDHPNQVEFIFLNEGDQQRCSKTITLQTAAISEKPGVEVEIVINQLPDVYNGLYFISNLRVGLDQYGETRWYYQKKGNYFGKVRNGNFIVADTANLRFFEVTMFGQAVREFYVPYGLHHEIFEMPGGNFLVASHSPPGIPHEDRVVEISRSTGAVVKTWDFKTILDPSREALPSTLPDDWLHINALYYDEYDNSIVISGRSQSAVVKIDYATNAIRWIMANPGGWNSSLSPFLLTPVNSQGNSIDARATDFWMYGQHAVHRLPNGNILLYDNGDYRGFYDDPEAAQDSYTRIAEYKVNENQMTVELVWHFDNNRDVFTKFTGYTQNLDATRLAAYMFISEKTPRIVEVNLSNQVVYEATINRGKASYYRTLKMDLYQGID